MISGLHIDQWVERIPAEEQMTGVTYHFNAPQSRPPQVLLLAGPPAEGQWSYDLLLATLRDTLDWARTRAVAPETLQKFGHHFPAIYL